MVIWGGRQWGRPQSGEKQGYWARLEGDLMEPDDGIAAIGSGAPYATAAAKALLAHSDLSARDIVEAAMGIAAELCIFTNDRFTIDAVSSTVEVPAESESGNA